MKLVRNKKRQDSVYGFELTIEDLGEPSNKSIIISVYNSSYNPEVISLNDQVLIYNHLPEANGFVGSIQEIVFPYEDTNILKINCGKNGFFTANLEQVHKIPSH